jgi:sigma-B regulation protein RsbU (phosphoserine phosphatase)
MRRRFLLALAVLHGLATATYSVTWMYCVRQVPPARLGITSDSPEIVRVEPGSPADRAGLRPRDVVLSLDGEAVSAAQPLSALLTRRKPGEVVRLAVRRSGEAVPTMVEVALAAPHVLPRLSGIDNATNEIISVYPLLFLLVSVPVLLLRYEDRNAWLLALLFAALIAAAPFFGRDAHAPGALRGFAIAYKTAFNSLAPSLFYFFFAVFPAPSSIDRRWPWLKWLLLGIGAAVGLPVALASLLTGDTRAAQWLLARFGSTGIERPFVVYNFGGFLLGFASLIANARAAEDAATRRKARVILWGTLVGNGPILALNLASLATGWSVYSFPLWFWAPCVMFLLLWPLSFAYAVVRHRVLEVPLLLKRSARYLLVQRGFLVLVAVVVLAEGALVSHLVSRLGGSGRFDLGAGVGAGIAFGLLLALSAAEVHRRVSRRIDRAFFRAAYDARRLLEDLAQKARTADRREDLARLLEGHLRDALHPASLAVHFAEPGGRLQASGPGPAVRTVDLPPRLLARLEKAPRTLDVEPDDAADLGEVGSLAPECLVPMRGRSPRLLGLLVLGPRLSEEPYSGEDKALLAAAASQAGLALESIAMAEEIASRLDAERRAARELEIARDVQRKLLPQRRPSLATLDYAGDCVQARAVGGDYWDVLDLGAGSLGLVLADISGKGISAALLMANLQASLRSRPAAAFADLPLLLRALNRHLMESTETSRYATLFLGVYDDARRRLRYANCGHGPPLLIRASGAVERLVPTAPVIGLFDEWEPGVAEVDLAGGDWLVLFTDGVTEAASPAGEEFGEARLRELVEGAREAPAGRALDDVMGALAAWGLGAEQWDDQTLLLVRAR